MEVFRIVAFLIFGTIIGSFLNVVIFRFNTRRSLGGRSGCMSCMKKLQWYELIPVLSYVFQGGRCRGCKTKLSAQYPTVEFITGLLFALLYLKWRELFFIDQLNFALTFAYGAVMFAILIVISVYDLRHKIIPDNLSLLLGLLAFLGLFVFTGSGASLHLPNIWDVVVPVIVALVFALMWLVSKGTWMGLGDAKLVLGLGFMLGFEGTLSAIALSFWIGATVGLALMSLKKIKGMKSEIPFAPFLVLGTLISYLFDLNLFMIF
jgi:prepilin signal peptidase PulO-like enzyme (type II secretory pathway)